MTRPSAAAILLAAGRSDRMDGRDKTLALLLGLPVAAYSLRAFAACDGIDALVLVCGPGNRAALTDLATRYGAGKVTALVDGGARRRDSVANGLRAVVQADLVAVHDVARPLLTVESITRGLDLAARHGAAVAAMPISDTLKEATPDRLVRRTLPRHRLWAAQTPQVFRRALLVCAHAAGDGGTDDMTDDAMLVEAAGEPVVLYEGPRDNLKLTLPQDFALAEALLTARAAAPAAAR